MRPTQSDIVDMIVEESKSAQDVDWPQELISRKVAARRERPRVYVKGYLYTYASSSASISSLMEGCCLEGAAPHSKVSAASDHERCPRRCSSLVRGMILLLFPTKAVAWRAQVLLLKSTQHHIWKMPCLARCGRRLGKPYRVFALR